MQKKRLCVVATVAIIVFTVLGIVCLWKPTDAASLGYETTFSGIVDKKPDEAFIVRVDFKNKGSAEGTWNITVTFEGEDWTWEGMRKQLTLEPDRKETLTWEGRVPENAVVDSTARLIVYYEDKYAALNWWIRVIAGAELFIVDSKVS